MKIGDKVVMNDKYFVSEDDKDKVWTICSEPWNYCGTILVLLKGRNFGYPANGLNIVEVHE